MCNRLGFFENALFAECTGIGLQTDPCSVNFVNNVFDNNGFSCGNNYGQQCADNIFGMTAGYSDALAGLPSLSSLNYGDDGQDYNYSDALAGLPSLSSSNYGDDGQNYNYSDALAGLPSLSSSNYGDDGQDYNYSDALAGLPSLSSFGDHYSSYNTGRNSWSSCNDTSSNAVQIALGEIGVNEADGSCLKYSGGKQQAWCADFVSWVYAKANGGRSPWGHLSSVKQLKAWGQRNGRFVEQKNGGGIKPGDVIIYKKHTGIVTGISADGKIHTTEGNYIGEAVCKRTVNPGFEGIQGFVKMS